MKKKHLSYLQRTQISIPYSLFIRDVNAAFCFFRPTISFQIRLLLTPSREGRMYRSASTTRVSDEFYSGGQPAVTGRMSLPGAGGQRSSLDHLPKYSPQSEIAKREASRLRFAQNAVHFIPVILIACALVLWLFSTPHIDMLNKLNKGVPNLVGKSNTAIDGRDNATMSSIAMNQEGVDYVKQVFFSKVNRKTLKQHEF